MRTLSSTLTTAQQGRRVKPAVLITLTHDSTEYSYGVSRIKDLKHEEQPYRHTAEIVLDNADGEFTSKDLKGFEVSIGWGVDSEYSYTAPLNVMAQRLDSAQGVLTCTLSLEGIPNQLAEDRASEDYTPDSTDTKTVKTLIREIAGDSGVTQLACYSHCKSYEVVFDSEDTLIDTYMPKDSFRIYINGSRLACLRRLLDYTKTMMRFRADGKIHIVVPVVTGIVYDYEYSLEDE